MIIITFYMQLPTDIFSFFSDLQQNNNRDWFAEHKPRFKSLETEVKNFGEQLKDKLIMRMMRNYLLLSWMQGITERLKLPIK